MRIEEIEKHIKIIHEDHIDPDFNQLVPPEDGEILVNQNLVVVMNWRTYAMYQDLAIKYHARRVIDGN